MAKAAGRHAPAKRGSETAQNGATQLTSETDSFTGVLASGNVTLTIDQSILGASNLSGTFDGSVLTSSIPNSDGTLQQVTLRPASLSDYDHDVAALKVVAQQNLLAQQQAQRQQAVAAARAEAAKQVDDAISAVQGDMQGLAQDSSFSDVLSQVAGAPA